MGWVLAICNQVFAIVSSGLEICPELASEVESVFRPLVVQPCGSCLVTTERSLCKGAVVWFISAFHYWIHTAIAIQWERLSVRACIFISYRRDDSQGATGRFYDRLSHHFGRGNLFLDVDAIEPGVDFVKILDEQIARCNVFIVMIGPNWTEARDSAGQRRLDDPEDYVRIEIVSALKRDIRIIPVLVDGACVPQADHLPDPIRPLVRRNAVEITHTRFVSDVDALAADIKRALGIEASLVFRLLRIREPKVGIALALAALAVLIAGASAWLWRMPTEWVIPHGFLASEFRIPDRAHPPFCDFGAPSEPVPINSSGLANLALLKAATVSASSILEGFPGRHQIKFVNDGWYNNCRSWVAASMPAWIEIDLGALYEISLVKFGSEHAKRLVDRAPTQFTIALRKTPSDVWHVVVDHSANDGAITGTATFSFTKQLARFVKISILATENGDQVRIDEVEVYGRHLEGG
jgi:hypothetical protein